MRHWAIGLLAVALPIPASAQDRPEDLVRAAVEAAGGTELLNKFPAGRVTAKGTITEPGAEVPVAVEQVYHLPARSRTVIRSEPRGQKLELAQVVNGPKARQMVNGNVIPLTEATTRELHTAVLLLEIGQLTPLLTDPKFALKPEKPGKSVDVGVFVFVRGYPELRLGFDRKTAHLVRVSRKSPDPDTGKEVELELVLSDFKAFAGLTRPTRAVVLKDGRKALDLTTVTFTPLEKVDPKEFDIGD
ncbi:MAG TPA: hypothetical protein VKE74_06075 [Gemmataceae bacterium]|nr:hypothetical protein [Gemmataceae bacterium]